MRKSLFLLLFYQLLSLPVFSQPFTYHKHVDSGSYDRYGGVMSSDLNARYVSYYDATHEKNYIDILNKYGENRVRISADIDTQIIYKKRITDFSGSRYEYDTSRYSLINGKLITIQNGDLIFPVTIRYNHPPIFLHTDSLGRRIGNYYVLQDSNYAYYSSSIDSWEMQTAMFETSCRLYSIKNSDNFYLLVGKYSTKVDTIWEEPTLVDSTIITVYKMTKDFDILMKKDFVCLEKQKNERTSSPEFQFLSLFQPTLDGGFLISSRHEPDNLTFTDARSVRRKLLYLDKYNANGEHEWQKSQLDYLDTTNKWLAYHSGFYQMPDSGYIFQELLCDSALIYSLQYDVKHKAIISVDKYGNTIGVKTNDELPRFFSYTPLSSNKVLLLNASNPDNYLLYDRKLQYIKPIYTHIPMPYYFLRLYPNDIGGAFYQTATYKSGNSLEHDFYVFNFDSNLIYNPNILSGRVANDVDNNCAINYIDKFRSNTVKAVNKDDGSAYYGFCNDKGAYTINVPTGNYDIIHKTYSHVAPSCGKYNNLDVHPEQKYTGLYFCDTIVPQVKDLRVYILNSVATPQDCQIQVCANNYGSDTVRTQLKVVIDNRFSYVDVSYEPISINGDTSVYELNLPPDSGFFFKIDLLPKIAPYNTMDSFTFYAYAPYANTDTLHADCVTLKTTFKNAWENTALFTNQPLYVSAEQEIAITTCFRNYETDTAKHVVIDLELDKEFDISSYELLSYTLKKPEMSILYTGHLQFRFHDIALAYEKNACFSYKMKYNELARKGDTVKVIAKKYVEYTAPMDFPIYSTFNIINYPEREEIITQYPQLQVYPNPTTGHVNIILPENCNAGLLSIYDLTGRQVYTKQIADKKTELQLDVAAGIYLVKLANTATKATYVEKLMIQH